MIGEIAYMLSPRIEHHVSTEGTTESGNVVSDVAMTEESDDPKNNLFTSSNSDWVNKTLPQIR